MNDGVVPTMAVVLLLLAAVVVVVADCYSVVVYCNERWCCSHCGCVNCCCRGKRLCDGDSVVVLVSCAWFQGICIPADYLLHTLFAWL